MGARAVTVEQLWTLPDGTVCQLAVRADAPCYELSVKRGNDILRVSRLYARGSAHMLAETWRRTLTPIDDEQQSFRKRSEIA
jgi:hypothetical protein